MRVMLVCALPPLMWVCKRASGRVRDRVLERRRRRAGHQVDQSLVVAIAAERQVADRLRRDLRVRIGFVGLQQRLRSLQPRPSRSAGRLPVLKLARATVFGLTSRSVCCRCAEALAPRPSRRTCRAARSQTSSGRLHRYRRSCVVPVSLLVNGYCGARDNSIALVRHGADDGSIKHLRGCGLRRNPAESRDQQHP